MAIQFNYMLIYFTMGGFGFSSNIDFCIIHLNVIIQSPPAGGVLVQWLALTACLSSRTETNRFNLSLLKFERHTCFFSSSGKDMKDLLLWGAS